MIAGAVFVPSTPLLVPVVASGAASELDEVRDASVLALRDALTSAHESVVILGTGTRTARYRHGTGSMRGFGVAYDVPLDPAAPSTQRLPLAITIGAWLLAQVGWLGERVGIEIDPASDDAALDAIGAALVAQDGRTLLLVVGDGSAARTEKAPASLHPEAAAFDAAWLAALASGSPAALGALDARRAVAVTAVGRPAWRVAAAALEGSAYDATVLAEAAPYGVGYLVARWSAA